MQTVEAKSKPSQRAPPALQNGTYTVSHPNRGHFTVKVGTAQKGDLAGKRIIYLLTGPDNVRDFTGVAFWLEDELDPNGKPWPQAKVWQRFRGPNSYLTLDGWHYQYGGGWSTVEQKLAIFLDLALRAIPEGRSHWKAAGYEIQCSARCLRCNRELTHPESLLTGMGPECEGRK